MKIDSEDSRPSQGIDVLLLDGNTRAALAAARSLGKAEYRVAVASPLALGIASKTKYLARPLISPDPQETPKKFQEWLGIMLESLRPRFVLPMTDVTLEVVSEVAEHFPKGTILPFPPKDTLARATRKDVLMQTASELGLLVPKSLSIPQKAQRNDTLRQAILDFQYPACLKPASTASKQGDSYQKGILAYPNSGEEVLRTIEETEGKTHSDFHFLLQEKIEGRGVGVFGLFVNGEPITLFAHRRLLEKPPTGGVSVLSESLSLEDAPVEEALRIFKHFRWQGIGMAEFKELPNGEHCLLEINPRFWGSLQLAIYAKRDFPTFLCRLFEKGEVPTPENIEELRANLPEYRTGIRLRWLLGSLDYFFLCMKSSPLETLRAVCTKNALRILQEPKTYFDVFHEEDPQPFFHELRQYFSRR